MADTGLFIVLDGIEGCGKSTQARRLADALRDRGLSVQQLRDPGSTEVGERIRRILLDPAVGDMAMRCEMLLYMAARAQMMHELILPALAEGKTVVCDRFISSTLAYQGGDAAVPADEILGVGKIAVGGRMPDLTLVLDLPVDAAFARIRRERDRIELRSAEYFQLVRRRFLEQAAADPRQYAVVDAAADPQSVHALVLHAVERVLGR